MSDHPYKALPPSAYWKKSVAAISCGAVDPVVRTPFVLTKSDRIATAGSCFAQHIARHLQASGYRYLVTEPHHPIISLQDAREFNYGVYTARYGNVYTTRQLLQLIERAYGTFIPQEEVWHETDGRFVDPFRPQIQPGGFGSLREFRLDREKHLASVREALESLDVLVFTLGLTEAWRDRRDGAVFPLCPGVAGGRFDPEKYEFCNFDVPEVADDLKLAIDELRRVNPAARVVLTVSPVPLIATASNEHVLTATTYSKSVLRVAAERVARDLDDVCYFPSYEIVTGPHSRGAYFADDLRSVKENGVQHVMRVFFKHLATDRTTPTPTPQTSSLNDSDDRHSVEMQRLVKVNCDENALDAD